MSRLTHNVVFDQEWLGGINPYRTTGREGVVGATRAFNFTGLNNATNEYYQIAEVVSFSSFFHSV